MFFGGGDFFRRLFLHKLLTIISVADIMIITEVVVMRKELIICLTQHLQKRYITFCCR